VKQTQMTHDDRLAAPCRSGSRADIEPAARSDRQVGAATRGRFKPSAERRADSLDVAAQPAMCWIGIQPWVPEQ
jgi:hypothetical protein